MTLSKAAFALTIAVVAASCTKPAPLPVPRSEEVLTVPTTSPPAGMSIAAISAGSLTSRASYSYEGGKFGDKRIFGVGGILVRHPQGTLLFDAGFGPDFEEHVKTAPLLLRLASKPQGGVPVADQLRAAGIDPASLTAVVLTHAHWDHVSGLQALPKTPVWVPQAELDFVNSGDRMTALARQLGTANYRPYDFPDGDYLGLGPSRDVFKDGSVVLVQAGGHTPGSIVAFINLPGGKRYALIGDIAWQSEGVDLPAQKPSIVKAVDADRAGTAELLVRLHRIKAAVPGLVIVPAHDRRAWDTLPRLSDVSAPKAP